MRDYHPSLAAMQNREAVFAMSRGRPNGPIALGTRQSEGFGRDQATAENSPAAAVRFRMSVSQAAHRWGAVQGYKNWSAGAEARRANDWTYLSTAPKIGLWKRFI
jgi:hypothetical protein